MRSSCSFNHVICHSDQKTSSSTLANNSTFYQHSQMTQKSPPPTIDAETIKKIAELAALQLSEEEINLFVPQFKEILGHVQQMSEVPLEQPTPQAGLPSNVAQLREDTAEPSPVEAEQFSPYMENGYFKTPKVIE